MDELTSPQGSIALAIAALLLVLGFRLARPGRAREWVAVGAYAVALGTQVVAAQGLLPGSALPAGVTVRITGAALLVLGLILAGRSSRARRRAVMNTATPSESATRSLDPVYAGLALVVLGQLLRGPSVAGGAAASAAILINVWVALKARHRSRKSNARERG